MNLVGPAAGDGQRSQRSNARPYRLSFQVYDIVPPVLEHNDYGGFVKGISVRRLSIALMAPSTAPSDRFKVIPDAKTPLAMRDTKGPLEER